MKNNQNTPKRGLAAIIRGKKFAGILLFICIAVLIFPALAYATGDGAAENPSHFYMTAWSLLPPIIAIGLALITKEVYSSLFVGIVIGGLLYSNFSFEGTLTHVFNDGIVAVLADSYNVGILKIGRAHV